MPPTHSFLANVSHSPSESGDQSSGPGTPVSHHSSSSEGLSVTLFEHAKEAMENARDSMARCTLTPEEANAVLDVLFSTPKQKPSTAQQRYADEPTQFRFLCLLGDYAGRLWKSLLLAARATNQRLPDRPGKAAEKLAFEDSNGPGELTETIESCLKYLKHEDLTVTPEMARLAINIYATRNQVCHSDVGRPEIAKQPRALRGAIDKDIQRLPKALPFDQVSNRDDLERLMYFYGDSAEWLDDMARDRTEVHHGGSSPQLQHTEDALDLSGLRDVSPVKSGSVSPSKRTASGSSKPAVPEPSTCPVASTIDEGPHANDGILEVIAKLQSKGNCKARDAIEEARRSLLVTLESLEQKEEDLPRKRGRWS